MVCCSALQALERYQTEMEQAEHIKRTFDDKHGEVWHCIVGTKFGELSHIATCGAEAIISPILPKAPSLNNPSFSTLPGGPFGDTEACTCSLELHCSLVREPCAWLQAHT